MKKSQQGATLIVVLVLLLIITVIGTLAVRNSLTTLNIATNSQAQQLLVQNSDSAIFNVENPDFLIRNLAYDGLFGYMKTDANKGKELVFCYKGMADSFYDFSRASFMQWVSGTAPSNRELGLEGYCKIGNANFFTSARRAVMTQVSVKVKTNTEDDILGIDDPFSHMQLGTDTETAKIDKSEKILVTATSIIPALSSASEEEINDCFSTRMNQVVIPNNVTPSAGMDKSVAQCLQELGMPVNTQVTEYNLVQAFDQT